MEELIGEFDWERNVFQPNDADERTIIGTLQDGTTVKGKAKEGDLQTGLTYRFAGHWYNHPKYKWQFLFSSFILAQPAGERGTVLYLAKAKGIGRKRALKIWELYGADSLKTLRTDPDRVAAAISGLTEETCRAAAEQFKQHIALEQTTIALTDLLGSRGFPRKLIQRCIETWGAEAPEIIREDAYSLLRFKGVGFLLADRLYLELGGDPAAIKRQGLCVWYAMQSNTEGHVWFSRQFLQRALESQVAGDKIRLAEAVLWAQSDDRIVDRVQGDAVWYAESKLAMAEAMVASLLHRAACNPSARWPHPADVAGASEHQIAEAYKALAGRWGILAGSPGTGKTWLAAGLMSLLPAAKVCVCAPTGKAAMRMTEVLQARGLNLQAKTIHSTLGVITAEGGWEFEHTASNPLPFDFLFVDESSMIDIALLANLLDACPPDMHILFIGDPDQLSPVGPGAPLRDMIAAGIPCGHLKEIQRQGAGRIVRTCAEIRDHGKLTTSPAHLFDPKAGEDLLLMEKQTPDEQIKRLADILLRAGSNGHRDPVWDYQVLVAVNAKSKLGRKPLNKLLQGALNSSGKQAKGNPFRVGDKIVCLQNGLLPVEGKDVKTFVANGEQARVIEVQPKYTVAETLAPLRTIRIPRGESNGDDTGCNWDLAYALSVHKSQGSEWPVVIVMIDSYPGAVFLCDKHWLYTAASRAKEFCLLIGKGSTARAMCRKSHMWNRKTFLREELESLRMQSAVTAWDRELTEVGP